MIIVHSSNKQMGKYKLIFSLSTKLQGGLVGDWTLLYWAVQEDISLAT